MSHQGNAWEREYRNPKLVTKNDGPQADVLRFLKFLKKEQEYIIENKVSLDLGSGTGRNANYLADLGCKVVGIEISKTALEIAKQRAKDMHVNVDYRLGDIGVVVAYQDIESKSVDLILDVTSSNSLSEGGRAIYLKESFRILKTGGYMFVRALCKDGDKNAKSLLKQSPGKDPDTYILKDMGLIERIFSKEDFLKVYGALFKILKLEKKSGYATMNGRIYKRNYWLAYLQK